MPSATSPAGTELGTAVQSGVNVQYEPFLTQTAGDASNWPATDNFVANAIAYVNPASAVNEATTTVLPNSPTYSNGTAGVGATLTAGSAAALTIDGVAVALNDRVLVKNQASTFQNGVYTVTTLGTVSVPYVLTRAVDYNTPQNVNYTGTVPVIAGSTNANTNWLLVSTITAIGSPNAITYVQQTSGGTSGGGGSSNVKGSPPFVKNAPMIGQGGNSLTSIASAGTSGQVLVSGGSNAPPAYQLPIAQNLQTANYQLALSDANNVVNMNVSGAATVTIPANATTAFPVGTVVGIMNTGTGALTVAITTDTLETGIGGALVTGSIVVPIGGQISILKVATTTWFASVGSPGMVLLGRVTTSGAATSVAFSGIPTSYNAIKVIYSAKTTDTGSFANLVVQFNGDTTSGDYPNATYLQFNIGTGSPAGGTVSGVSASGVAVGQVQTTTTGSTFASGEVNIPNYAQTTFPISTFGTSFRYSSTSADNTIQTTGGIWIPSSLAAITSMVFRVTNASNVNATFTNGSVFSLYVIP